MTLDPFQGFNPDQVPPLPEGRYTFTTAHGELFTCDLCGVVVRANTRDRHALWHWSFHLVTTHAQFHWHPEDTDRPVVDGDLYNAHLVAVGSEPIEHPEDQPKG